MKKNSTRNRSRSYSPYSRQSVETDINDLRIALIEFGITPTEELITEMVYNLYIK